MTDEKLGDLLEAFAACYWAVPVLFATDKIQQWHPEVTDEQLGRVLKRCNEALFWHHCCVVPASERIPEPVLAAEHLVAFDDDLERFLAAQIDGPYFDCGESALFVNKPKQLDIPEVNAILDFARAEFGVDDDWAEQLVDDCAHSQQYALIEGNSWVMMVLHQESFGKLHFRTVEQVRRFRELGNRLYWVWPSPVCKGRKPSELADPPVPADDIPASDEDIPDHRPIMRNLSGLLNERGAVGRPDAQRPSEAAPKKRKIGRNEPCPCGSGKKYKKCCGR